MPTPSDRTLNDEIRAALWSEAGRCIAELSGEQAAGAEQPIERVAATFDKALAHHRQQFREAGRTDNAAVVIAALRKGRFAHGKPQDCDLWADIALATLLEQRDEHAIRRYSERFGDEIRTWQRRYAPQDPDIADDFLSDLILPRDDRPPRIDSYAGWAPLRSWLKQVFLSVADHRRRKRRRELVSEGGLDAATCSTPHRDGSELPEDEYARRECTERLAPVIRETFAALAGEDLLILKLTIIDDVPQKAVAQFLGIHEGNVSRRRQKAEETIRARFFEQARTVARMSEEAVRRCWELIAARFGELAAILAQD